VAVAAGALSATSLALYYASLPRLGLGAGTGLSMTAPAFIVVITAVIMRKAPSVLSIVGCGVIACGALAITAARGGGETLGIALALLGALTFAVFVTVLAEALRDGSPVELALVVALAAGATSGVLALVDEGLQGFAITPAELTIIAFGAVGSGAIPTLVRAWSLPEIGPPVVGALGVLAPVMTVLLSMVLLDAGRSPLAMLGVLAIAAGAAIAALAPLLIARRAA
jgi:drug/metabolite transporter (DMT)-like permease